MAVSVNLSDIIDGIESNSDFTESYIHKKTGKVYSIPKEYFRGTEDEKMMEDSPDWEKEVIKIAKEIIYSGDYIALPDKFDMNEYGLMERFCLSLSDEEIRENMYYSIKGRGAFRIFKDNIHQYGLADEWYRYRDGYVKELAIDWCKENNFKILEE